MEKMGSLEKHAKDGHEESHVKAQSMTHRIKDLMDIKGLNAARAEEFANALHGIREVHLKAASTFDTMADQMVLHVGLNPMERRSPALLRWEVEPVSHIEHALNSSRGHVACITRQNGHCRTSRRMRPMAEPPV